MGWGPTAGDEEEQWEEGGEEGLEKDEEGEVAPRPRRRQVLPGPAAMLVVERLYELRPSG